MYSSSTWSETEELTLQGKLPHAPRSKSQRLFVNCVAVFHQENERITTKAEGCHQKLGGKGLERVEDVKWQIRRSRSVRNRARKVRAIPL